MYAKQFAYSSLQKGYFLVRAGRIELPSAPWQGAVLPLNHARLRLLKQATAGRGPLELAKARFVRQSGLRRARPAKSATADNTDDYTGKKNAVNSHSLALLH